MKKRTFSHILVTGGCGFMGSCFIRYLLKEPSFGGKVCNLDLLTYAGKEENVKEVANSPRYTFVQGDIGSSDLVEKLILEKEIDCIVNFAAETHVDRSIANPSRFMDTNIRGVYALLENIRKYPHVHFHQISTDEVFGSLGESGVFLDHSPYRPNSPYAASKAAADHLVRAYAHTYKIKTTLSRSANNYGPCQHPEKLIPLMITHALKKKSLPVYGSGRQVREWLFVEEHAAALFEILQWGEGGETYNIGGSTEMANIDLILLLLKIIAEEEGTPFEDLQKLITFIGDRPGHDFRYAMDASKLALLGFTPKMPLKEGLRKTVRWFQKRVFSSI